MNATLQSPVRRIAALDRVSYLELMYNPLGINRFALTTRDPAWQDDVERIGREHGVTLEPFGEMQPAKGNAVIQVVG